jgi:hypothetical protein
MTPEVLGFGILVFEIIVINNMLYANYYGGISGAKYST